MVKEKRLTEYVNGQVYKVITPLWCALLLIFISYWGVERYNLKIVKERQISNALKVIAENHLQNNDLLAVVTSLNALKAVFDGTVICLKINNRHTSYDKRCIGVQYKVSEGIIVESSIEYYVQEPILKTDDLLIVFFFLLSSGVFFFIFLRSRSLTKTIENEVNSLTDIDSNRQSIFIEINNAKKKLKGYFRQKEIIADEEKAQAIIRLSQQVAHDIKSPLAAFDIILEMRKQTDEDKMLFMATERIRDIVSDLSQSILKSEKNNSLEAVDIFKSIFHVVEEKSLLYKNDSSIKIEVSSSIPNAFCRVSEMSLKRIISNLISNSIEAKTSKELFISFSAEILANKFISLKVKDNGRGIPKNYLSRLGTRGFTVGKEEEKDSGSGLGLYHAKKLVADWGGELNIESELGVGTEIEILLPLV